MLIFSGTEINAVWANGDTQHFIAIDGYNDEAVGVFKRLFHGVAFDEVDGEFRAEVKRDGYHVVATVPTTRYTKDQITETPHDVEITY